MQEPHRTQPDSLADDSLADDLLSVAATPAALPLLDIEPGTVVHEQLEGA